MCSFFFDALNRAERYRDPSRRTPFPRTTLAGDGSQPDIRNPLICGWWQSIRPALLKRGAEPLLRAVSPGDVG